MPKCPFFPWVGWRKSSGMEVGVDGTTPRSYVFLQVVV